MLTLLMDKETDPKTSAASHVPEGTAGANVAWSIVSLLLSGILVWGGIGWFLDRQAGTSLFLPLGILLGAAGAMFLVIRRFGAAGGKSQQDSTGKI